MKGKSVYGNKGVTMQSIDRGWVKGIKIKTGVGKKQDPPVTVARSLAQGDIVTRSRTADTGEVIAVTATTVLVEVWAGTKMEQQEWPLSEAHRL